MTCGFCAADKQHNLQNSTLFKVEKQLNQKLKGIRI